MKKHRIFILKNKVNVDVSADDIVQRLRRICIGKFKYSSTDKTFGFLISGVAAGFKLTEICYVSGSVLIDENGVSIEYNVFPGYLFWICCIADIAINAVGLYTVFPGILHLTLWEFFVGMLFSNAILILGVLEGRRQQKFCDRRIVTQVVEGKKIFVI